MTPEQLAELFVEDTGDNIAGIATDIEILLKRAYRTGYECAVAKTEEWLDENAYKYCDDIDNFHESAMIGDLKHVLENGEF